MKNELYDNEYLRDAMQRQELSVGDLTRIINDSLPEGRSARISRATVWGITTGRVANPRILTLRLISKSLGCSMKRLVNEV